MAKFAVRYGSSRMLRSAVYVLNAYKNCDPRKEAFKTQTWWGKKNLEWGGGQSPDDIDDDDNWHEHSTLTLLARVFNTYPN